jgi:putative oxidoreductase
MNKIFSPIPLLQNNGLALIRIIIGVFLIYHGWEIFSAAKMNEYMAWGMFKNSSSGKLLVYSGKAGELIAGIFLFMGLFTRIAAIILIGTMAYISFFIRHGKIWYEDQYPFLFLLLGLVFFFMGGGRWSMDHLLFNRTKL